MKTAMLITCLLLLLSNLIFGEEFIRNLPDKDFANQLKAKDYPNSDAVIIVKEQSLQVQKTRFTYYDETYTGPTTSYSKILIVKLFNDRAVERYGSFEYEYPEFFGDEFPNGFTIRARAMKEDGTIIVLPEKEIQRIVSNKSKNGTPISRKVLFKFPNLTPGDVIQIEFQFDEIFSFSSSGIYFYNDKDYVLFSNFYLTLPLSVGFKVYSNPISKLGFPQISQMSQSYGSGKTYFWSVKNLDPTPDEPFGRPFEETSLYTAYTCYDNDDDYTEKDQWNDLSKRFFKKFIDNGSISNKQIELLGFRKLNENDSVNYNMIDKLYTAIRTNFSLKQINSIYPFADDIDELFESNSGNASDLAILMYKVLEKWKHKSNIVWIRDRRDGTFDNHIPTRTWFDRLGVLVNINGAEKVYVFDESISVNYKMPWFLYGVNIIVVDEDSCYKKELTLTNEMQNNYISEIHKIKFNTSLELSDSLDIEYCGSKAESFRSDLFGKEYYEVNDELKVRFNKYYSTMDSIAINEFQNNEIIKIDLLGSPLVKPEILDSFVVFRMNSSIIREFKDQIFTNLRKSDFCFESPFILKTQWEIELPEGYKLKESFPNKSLNSPSKAFTDITFKRNGNKIVLSAEIKFSQHTIPAGNYNDLINLLDRTLKVVEKDIVLKKM